MVQQTLQQSLASMARQEVAATAEATQDTDTVGTLAGVEWENEQPTREVGGLAETAEEASLDGHTTDASAAARDASGEGVSGTGAAPHIADGDALLGTPGFTSEEVVDVEAGGLPGSSDSVGTVPVLAKAATRSWDAEAFADIVAWSQKRVSDEGSEQEQEVTSAKDTTPQEVTSEKDTTPQQEADGEDPTPEHEAGSGAESSAAESKSAPPRTPRPEGEAGLVPLVLQLGEKPLCFKCGYECKDVYRAVIRRKTKAQPEKWICRCCNCVSTMVSRKIGSVPELNSMSEGEQQAIYRDASELMPGGAQLSWARLRGVIVKHLEQKLLQEDSVEVSEEALPLTVWEKRGYDIGLIEQFGDSERHPIFGLVYKVPIKKIKHKAIIQRVQDLLDKAEQQKKRCSGKRKHEESTDDDDEKSGEAADKRQRTGESEAAPSQQVAPAAQPGPAVDNPVFNALQQFFTSSAQAKTDGGKLLLSQILTSLASGGSSASAATAGRAPTGPAGADVPPPDPKEAAKLERQQKKEQEKEQKAADKAAQKAAAQEEAAQKKAMAGIDRENNKVSALAMKAQLILSPLVPALSKASKGGDDIPESLRRALQHDLKASEQYAAQVNKVMAQSKKVQKGQPLPALQFSLGELQELQKSANKTLSKIEQLKKILT